jgi:hypothetical protein
MRRFLVANPFLSLGLLGTAIFGFWLLAGLDPSDGGVGQATFYLWRVLAAPVHVAANVLSPLTDGWPDPLDGAAAVLAGLLPCMAADGVWRRWNRGRRPRVVAGG